MSEKDFFKEMRQAILRLTKDTCDGKKQGELLGLVSEVGKLRAIQYVKEVIEANSDDGVLQLESSDIYVAAAEKEMSSRTKFPFTHFRFLLDKHEYSATLWETYEDGLNEGLTEAIIASTRN